MSRHIRILAGSLMPTAGSHIYNRELIRRLAERGHRVSVVSLDDGGEIWDDIDVTCLPTRNWEDVPGTWRFATTLHGMQAKRDLASASLTEPDIVIATEHLFLKGHAQRFPDTPWLYLAHSLVIAHEIDSYGMTGIQRHLTRHFYTKQQQWALRHSSTIVRFNHVATDALRQYYGESVLHAPVLINPPGIDTSRCSSRKVSVEQDRPLRLLFVSRLVPSKNLGFVLRSLKAHAEHNWTLDIVGDGPDLQKSKELVQQLNIKSRVIFHGHQSAPADWYEKADLLLFPSKLENMPLVLLESMAHGTPALVIRGDGKDYRVPFSEVIDDNVSGLLARNEQDYVKRLAEIFARPDQLKHLSENARQCVRNRYSWERHLACFETQIENLLDGRPEKNTDTALTARADR